MQAEIFTWALNSCLGIFQKNKNYQKTYVLNLNNWHTQTTKDMSTVPSRVGRITLELAGTTLVLEPQIM